MPGPLAAPPAEFQAPDIPPLDGSLNAANSGATGLSPGTGESMLLPQHPRSVARRRAVAEMTVAATQAAAIEPGHVLHLAQDRPDAVPLAARREVADTERPIRFTVVYRLPEYLAILREHLPTALQARERARGTGARDRQSLPARIALRLLLPLVGVPAFLLKKRRMPVCHFAVDAAGIAREAADGRLFVAWRDVVAVHRLRAAWLVDKGDGALPIPRRCLDAAQRSAFELLVATHVGPPNP
jgi:hypothetical protein